MLLSAIAFSLWYAILSFHKAGEITMFRFVIPVAGVFLSAAFIQERPQFVHGVCPHNWFRLGVVVSMEEQASQKIGPLVDLNVLSEISIGYLRPI
jgi:hypothetical protein